MSSSSRSSNKSLLERRRGKKVDLKVNCLASEASSSEDIGDAYTMLECLGQGSLSVVYRAIQKASGQEVALKIVRTTDEEVVSTSRQEFLLLQRIQHPNIVRVFDFFVRGNRTVLVMNLYKGDALGAVVKNQVDRRLPESTACRLFGALLQALDHLHQHRIVHRDVKPENVLVSDDLKVLQLIDFNLARYLPEGGALSPNCTPAYAAPEVRKGGAPSEAADIWGAGLCLCMMLSGQCSVQHCKVQVDGIAASGACMAILLSCLKEEHSMRPAAMTLLTTDWVRSGIHHEDESGSPKRHISCSPSPSITSSKGGLFRQRSNSVGSSFGSSTHSPVSCRGQTYSDFGSEMDSIARLDERISMSSFCQERMLKRMLKGGCSEVHPDLAHPDLQGKEGNFCNSMNCRCIL
jgi:serine/threonine protein kinase